MRWLAKSNPKKHIGGSKYEQQVARQGLNQYRYLCRYLFRGGFYRIYVGRYSYLHSFIGCAGTADRGHSHDAVLLQDQEVWNVNDLRFAGGYFNAANWNGLLVYSYGTGFWADCRFNAEAFWV